MSLMLFQQITGQPSVLYYAGQPPSSEHCSLIFQQSGAVRAVRACTQSAPGLEVCARRLSGVSPGLLRRCTAQGAHGMVASAVTTGQGEARAGRLARVAQAPAPCASLANPLMVRTCSYARPAAKIFQAAGFAGAEEATGVSLILGFFKLVMTGEVGSWQPLLPCGCSRCCAGNQLKGKRGEWVGSSGGVIEKRRIPDPTAPGALLPWGPYAAP